MFKPAKQGNDQTNIDAVPIVRDLEQFQASILDENLQRSRAGVDGVFDQFFERMHRRNYDFSSGNLVHNVLIQGLWSWRQW